MRTASMEHQTRLEFASTVSMWNRVIKMRKKFEPYWKISRMFYGEVM